MIIIKSDYPKNKFGVNNRVWIGEKGNFDIDKKRTNDCQKDDMIMMTGYDLNLLISDMRMSVKRKKGTNWCDGTLVKRLEFGLISKFESLWMNFETKNEQDEKKF